MKGSPVQRSLSRRRLIMSAAAAAATLLPAAACANKDGEGAGGIGYAADRPPVTIEFWYMPYGGPVQDQAVITETEEFHKAHPNITVKAVRVPWDEALTRLSTASTSGEGPDVTVLGTTWVAGFSSIGALRPYSIEEIAAVGGEDVFAKASWSSSHLITSQEITALPWLIDIRALFYRTDVLRKLGLDPKEAFATWDSFEETLQKIKASDAGVAPLAIGLQNNFGIIHNVAPFIWGAGGDLIKDDGTKSMLAEPAAVDGVTYYQRLIGLYDDPKAMALSSSDVPRAFAEGTGAITIDNSQSVAEFASDPSRAGLKAGWSTAPMPAGKAGRFGFLGGSNLGILKEAKHPEAAFEFVRYLTGKASQQRYSVNSGLWPARTEAIEGTKLATEPEYAAFREMIPHGKMYPSVSAWIIVESVIAKDLRELWSAPGALGRGQVQEIMTRTTADIDEALRDPTNTGITP
ncbi:extracellular solute-binding protein [Dactylosporangium sp. NPDC049742]|uniref:extracellular solute-binding protein n=1 Tax=Dactylosporangium sp. NPDC049742 TaxID=3154737 RepID=UPI003418EE50